MSTMPDAERWGHGDAAGKARKDPEVMGNGLRVATYHLLPMTYDLEDTVSTTLTI
jgi:hypothetical protein